jgi:uncharacterized protein (TIGR02646 family)
MIDRHSVNCPSSLDTSTKDLVKGDYAKSDVLDALLEMQHFKCCYCEKDLSSLGKSERWIDHVVAKTDDSFKDVDGNTDWSEANAWGNLLYACGTCNRSKGEIPPIDSNGNINIMNPSDSQIDPEDHIEFNVDGVIIVYKERNGSVLGSNTIKNLKLKERLDVYSILRKIKPEIDSKFADLVNALSVRNNVMAKSKRTDLIKMTSANQPHASFCRKYIIQRVNKFNNNELQNFNKYYGTKVQPISIPVANGYQIIT